MKFRYLALFGIMLCGIGIIPFLCVEEVNLPQRFLGAGRWRSFSGYLAPYAVFGIAAVGLGIIFAFATMLGEVCRNNTRKAPI